MAIQIPLVSGGLPALSVQPTERKFPKVTRVTKGPESTRADTDTGNLAKGADNADIADNARKHRHLVQRSEPRPQALDPPVGPPPAFEISILEDQLDLERVLARLHAEFGQREYQNAIAPARDPASDRRTTDAAARPDPAPLAPAPPRAR